MAFSKVEVTFPLFAGDYLPAPRVTGACSVIISGPRFFNIDIGICKFARTPVQAGFILCPGKLLPDVFPVKTPCGPY